MSWIVLMLSLLCAEPVTSRVGSGSGAHKASDNAWQTAAKLDLALEQPVIATWQNAELRTVLRALSEQRHVAIVLDRRLDPQHTVTLGTSGESLRDVLNKLANGVDGLVSVTGQAVYIGPVNSAAKLKTLLTLRQEELQHAVAQLPAARRSVFAGQRSLRWNDLDTPAEILERLLLERDPKLVIKGLSLIPHDLWAMGETPPVGMAEALTLILIQADLTYQLDSTGTRLEIIPIPNKVAIERRFILPKAKAAEISKMLQVQAPQLETQTTPEHLVAVGTQEELEELERIIRSISGTSGSPKKKNSPPPLSKRRITFQAKDVPLNAILEKLATTGIEFDYDFEQLKRNGVKIDQLVEIDVKDVSPDLFFQKLLGPVGVAFEIDGLKVKLTAAK